MATEKFSTKATTVDALQWLPDASNSLLIITTFFASITGFDASPSDPRIRVATPTGITLAYPGDWFTTTPNGYVNIFRPQHFDDTFTKTG